MDPVFTAVAVFHLLVFVIGVPGNLLILRVFVKKTRKTSTNVFIMALASADLMACLLRPVFVGYYMVLYTTGKYPPIWLEITYFTLNFITVYSSSLVTAAIAFDRYDAVCRPHTRLMSYRGAQILAVSCFAVSLPMTIPCILLYFDDGISVRLAKHCETLAVYIFALILVLVFYIRVYKAVLFRTKVRTKWGGRFTGITAAAENSVSVTGQTEISALPPAREFVSKLRPVAEAVVLQEGNHVGGKGNQPQQLQALTCPSENSPPTDMEIVRVNDDKNSVMYRNLSSSSSASHNEPGVSSDLPPPYSSLTAASDPVYPPAVAGPSSSSGRDNLTVSTYSQIPESACTNLPQRTGSTGRQRTPSERGKSTSKTVAAKMQNKTTRMLLLTTIVFFVTWLPYMCLASMNIYMTATNRPLDKTLTQVFNTASQMLFINNAANPFIYVLANRQFRNDCKREIRKLLRSCSRR